MTDARFAVLFDWDGVLVDSGEAHHASWNLLAEELGHPPLDDAFFAETFGRLNRQIIRDLLGWTTDLDEAERLGRRKEEFYRALLRREGLAVLPGVRELLAALGAAGVPCAVGTSTLRENLTTGLQQAGLEGFFVGAATSEDVRLGKPDPEVFLQAAARTGLPPERCLVVEDSHHGIEAGRAGGMKTLALLTTHERGQMQGADDIAKDLSEVSVERMARLCGEGLSA